MRTTPTRGGVRSERHSISTARPPAARAKPTAIITGLLAMGLPPLQEERGRHSKSEIDDCQNPQTPPVSCHLPQARSQLVDTHESVDREKGGEDITDGLHWLGDRFARPGKTRQEQLRQACAEKNERWCFWMIEPGAYRLGHEAGRQGEHHCQREQLQWLAERRKSIDAWQHDKVERERWQVDGQMRNAASQHGCKGTAGALSQCNHRQ